MALPQLTSQDVGAPARTKLNTAIATIDAHQTEIEVIAHDIIAVREFLLSRIADGDDVLDGRLDAETAARASGVLSALTGSTSGARPGLCPEAFAHAALGPTAALAPLDPAGRITTPLGLAYRLDGAGLVAGRAAIPVDPDAIWVVKARYWRLADVLDPNNSAVDIGLQWLDAADGDLGRTLLRRENTLTVQDGPRMLTRRVPSLDGETPAIVLPRAAVSWRPYLRAYGGGAVALAVLGAFDATFAGVFAPDVSALASRLGTIEGQIAAGLPFTTPILPSYAVADLPKAGNRGRQAFARDGRAPSAAGMLEAANAGTGVEVVDNGTIWVISGTNQAVQA